MNNCKGCKHFFGKYKPWEGYKYCLVINERIKYPLFMGGNKKCECYCPKEKKVKDKFVYPTLDELNKR